MSNIPQGFIELLLAKVDIVTLINAQVPLRKKSSNNYFARCPFHQEKSPSFSVSERKQFYYCFGCGAHGNAIDFMMQHERLSFKEAIETLARQVGMEVPHTGHVHQGQVEALPALYELMATIASYYYEQLRKSERAIQYLHKRGITGQIAKQFRIGYAPPGWSHVCDTFGQTESEKKKLLDTGLIIKKDEGGYYDRFRDRVMFPIHDHRGRILGFGGRIIDHGEPKYLNSPETQLFQKGHELYGLYQTLKSQHKLDRILIVEGYMDVIALFQHQITYTVATLGTATTPRHLERLFRYAADIIFCFDGDEAGRRAAWRALQVALPMMHDELEIRFLFLPEGEDPDTLIRKEGKVTFEKRLINATSLSSFFFQTLGQECDLATMEGRARFAAGALNHLKQLSSEIFQGIMLDELSKLVRVSVDKLREQIKTSKDITPTEVTPNLLASGANAKMAAKLPNPVRLVMTLLIQHPELIHSLTTPLPQSSEAPWFPLLSQLIQNIHENPKITTGALIEYFRGKKEESFIKKLAAYEHMVPEDGLKNEFIGASKQLTLLTWDDEINRLFAKASQNLLTNEEKVELSSLISRKKQLTS